MLYVLFRCTDADYPFGIFKLFFQDTNGAIRNRKSKKETFNFLADNRQIFGNNMSINFLLITYIRLVSYKKQELFYLSWVPGFTPDFLLVGSVLLLFISCFVLFCFVFCLFFFFMLCLFVFVLCFLSDVVCVSGLSFLDFPFQISLTFIFYFYLYGFDRTLNWKSLY